MNKYSITTIALLFFITGCKKEFPSISNSSNVDDSNVLKGKPNVIVILADDIGYEVPTYTGGQTYSTPNWDLMASNSVKFCETRATPLCSPSRVQTMTGKYNFRNYINWGKINPDNYTIADLMKSAGYNTCIAGKWQLGGGDASIRGCGFDKYIVWDAFDTSSGRPRGYQYRNPTLFQDNVLKIYTHNEYGEDLIRNYMLRYIDSVNALHQNFFCLWTTNIGHDPHLPTPDDPDYLTVNPIHANSNFKYYPSMIKYLDKEIGILLNHLDSIQASNTYIIFLADNGSPKGMKSMWRGRQVLGGKNTPLYDWGTHVPMLVYKMDGTIIPKIDSSIVDLTDIMTTLSDLTGQPVPANDTFDGKSFWPQVLGLNNPDARQWSFTYFFPQPVTEPTNLTRFVENKRYKLYDSSYQVQRKNNIYRTANDTLEKYPLPLINPEVKSTYATFKHILDSLHR